MSSHFLFWTRFAILHGVAANCGLDYKRLNLRLNQSHAAVAKAPMISESTASNTILGPSSQYFFGNQFITPFELSGFQSVASPLIAHVICWFGHFVCLKNRENRPVFSWQLAMLPLSVCLQDRARRTVRRSIRS